MIKKSELGCEIIPFFSGKKAFVNIFMSFYEAGWKYQAIFNGQKLKFSRLSWVYPESEMEKMSEEKEKCFSESRRNGKNK